MLTEEHIVTVAIATISACQHHMDLGDWKISLVLSGLQDDEDANPRLPTEAEVWMVPSGREATIVVDPAVLPDDESVKAAVVHEMCHLLLADLDLAADTAAELLGGPDQPAAKAYDVVFTESVERAVGKLATVFLGQLDDRLEACLASLNSADGEETPDAADEEE
jgi:hypothetical protein